MECIFNKLHSNSPFFCQTVAAFTALHMVLSKYVASILFLVWSCNYGILYCGVLWFPLCMFVQPFRQRL